MEPQLPPALIGLTPGTLRGGAGFQRAQDALVAAARAAARGGLEALMVREPHLEDGAFLSLGRALREAFEGWLCVHDRVHLVDACGAQGAHLTARSLRPADARAVVGPGACVSVSTHDGDEDPGDGVDFALHAPVFTPHSKASRGGELGVDGLTRAVTAFGTPVLAMGGIDEQRVRDLAGSGAAGCAAIGALWGTDGSPLPGPGRSPLGDLDGIESRTAALVAAAKEIFGAGLAR